jgi:UDPglucose 6-dehydrogenase
MTKTLPRLTVLGTGYLGATHAICMAVLGYEVLGLDVDESKVEKLNSGEVPFFEPGLPEQLTKALESGRLRFTTSYEEAAAFGDVHFVCVGTPQQQGSHAADMKYVDASVRALAPHLTRKVLVVGKSTVPVGTAARLTGLIEKLAPAGAEVELAWNPEFLREGYAVDDTMRPDRLVFGVRSEWASQRLHEAFGPIVAAGTPVVVTDLATAELVKVAANSFLATKISYINAMAEVCETVGADVRDLAAALAHDDRTVDLVREQLGGGIEGARVAAFGAAFKPNSDDIRDSPALDVAATLHGLGATVTVYDPAANENARRQHPELNYGTSALDAARDADIVLLLTEWSDFRQIDPETLGQVVGQRHIVDGRHALDAAAWRAAGWSYRALGRP